MENAVDASKIFSKTPQNFFKHMTSFDEESQCQVLNIIQYSLLAVIPAIIILKAVKQFIPEEDDSKGSLEIAAECIAQIGFIMVAIWFSDRAIRWVPTYSSCEYTISDHFSAIIPFIIIMLTMQTKLSEKINILIERANEAWGGSQEDAVHYKGSGNVKVSQPLAGKHYPSQADHLDNSHLLPSMPGLTGMPQPQHQPQHQQHQQSPDFNQMYHSQVTSMPGAMNPVEGMGMMNQGPMAANAAIGGSFSNW